MSSRPDKAMVPDPDEASSDGEPTDPAPPPEPDEHGGEPDEYGETLVHGPVCSFGLSLVASAMLLAFLGMQPLLDTEGQPHSYLTIACAAAMTLSLLVAMPSWVVSTVYALGSVVTGQHGVGLALFALLLNAASAVVFLLSN